jgi:hypothetical protein
VVLALGCYDIAELPTALCCRRYKSRGVSSQCPRASRYASSASASATATAASSLELRELRRHNYKAAVLPNKSASYLEHRRTRSSRGMNMGQKISGM